MRKNTKEKETNKNIRRYNRVKLAYNITFTILTISLVSIAAYELMVEFMVIDSEEISFPFISWQQMVISIVIYLAILMPFAMYEELCKKRADKTQEHIEERLSWMKTRRK